MDAPQEIKSRLDIVDIIQEYLPMKPAGTGSFKGLCPFHKENTPSFFANRPRQSWHCFGCDEGGDLFDFVQRMEGMEFRESLEFLAQKAGVTLPSYEPKDRSIKKTLYDINDLASKWFRIQLLKNASADHARAYAETRGIEKLTADVWGIGYAPDSWDDLIAALKSKNIPEADIVKAGLASPKKSGNGVYSRFRDRLMFTITDHHGHVVGFTGRLLSKDAKEAKYVNTPETDAYKKSEVLFGLDKAKGEIKRHDLAIVVEGNMDVITSHAHGVTHVVASSGTALTEAHLRLLKRYTSNLAFAFDADAGGMAAAKRGVDLARQMGFSIRMIFLPDGAKDPDECIRKDVNAWKEAIAHAPEYLDWLYKLAFKKHGGHDPATKRHIAAEILPEIGRIAHPVERDGWIMKLSEDLSVAPSALREALSKQKRERKTRNVKRETQDTNQDPRSTIQGPRKEKTREEALRMRFMALLHLKPELRTLAESKIPAYTPTSEEVEAHASYLAILADREIEDRSEAALTEAMEQVIRDITNQLNRQRRHDLESQMQDAERAGDTARIQELSAEFQKLFN